MAVQSNQFTLTYKADADFSSNQFFLVKFSSTEGEVSICDNLADVPCGVLQNNPDAAGKEAVVMHMGMSKVAGNLALPVGSEIGTSATGRAKIAATGERVVGQVVTSTTATDGIASVLINGINPFPAP